MRKIFSILFVILISIMIGGYANAQGETVITPKVEKFPNKPITIIVPFGVGGALDLVARLIETESLKHINQPMIIVNRPGASGSIGWNELVDANPDGYTIGISSSEIFLNPLYSVTKYNYPTALDPIAQIATAPLLMVVRADQPWQNISDLTNYAIQNPGKLKFSHSGIGTQNHILGEAFSKMSNIKMKQVPFQSASKAMAALLGGHVQIAIVNPASANEYLKSGMIKVLAVAGEERMTDPLFANVPTFKEQGLNLVFTGRFGIAAPKDIPTEVKNQLAENLKAIITTPEFKKNIESMGLQYNYLGVEDSKNKWLLDNKMLTEAVYETGIIDLIDAERQ
ncbi:tripartite-type tricarboxylate transporter receptor subunit TctC [Sporomusaceae bacterium BoRhaA]|nr:tripartite-type tricarboxylate transporter receptor subunit TctC [Pelorhabdus rhamnosifermentans]